MSTKFKIGDLVVYTNKYDKLKVIAKVIDIESPEHTSMFTEDEYKCRILKVRRGQGGGGWWSEEGGICYLMADRDNLKPFIELTPKSDEAFGQIIKDL